MITIWKVTIKSGERDNFIDKYNLFSGAEGFLGCQFYTVWENQLIAIESWDSHESHKKFAKSLPEGKMWELFWLLEWQPEMYECELSQLIK